ncbi:MAG: TetR/AcrR family transcriptional regulator [Sphingobium sp.]
MISMVIVLPSPPALSRREARRRERRESILTLAARSFLESGYAATTMSGIAAKMGGSKGTLWSYFPSKEELFAAVLDHQTTAYRERLSRILDPCEELVPTLSRFCHALLEKVTSPDAIALNRLVTAEASRFPEVGNIFYEHAPANTRRLLAGYLAGAMDRGLLRRDDPERAAHALLTLIMAGCHRQMVWGLLDEASPDKIAADCGFALDLFLRAYAP